MVCTRLPVPAIVPLLIFFCGCGGSSAPERSDAGRTQTYQEGTPGFEIETIQVPGDSLSCVDLYLSVPYPSLIFEKRAGVFRSLCEVTARFSERSSTGPPAEVTWPDTTIALTYEATQSTEPITIRKRIQVPPGSYRVDVTLEDLVDGRKAVRSQRVTVIDPSLEGPAIGRISLLARKRDGTRIPQISFFVPVRSDSVECAIPVYNLPAGETSGIELRVIRFSGDTTTALPPYYYSVMAAPLGHTLVDFDRPDTIYAMTGTVRPAHRVEMLEFRIPPLRRGMCRIDFLVGVHARSGRDTVLSAGRYYSIQGPGYPRPVTFSELINASVYLATPGEMSDIRDAKGQEEQRKMFEDLWLKFGGDKPRAAELIRKYYARVEEANRLFTIVREGWRTDRGMLYCVLGPPSEVTNMLDTQTWYYDLGGNAVDNTYTFKRILRTGEGLSVEDYILYRAAGYEVFWVRMVGKWRSGEQP
jgi:GWxTD domain-containing protein